MEHYEIEACIVRAKGGSQEDLLKLVQQFSPYILKCAAQFRIRNYDKGDLTQVGYLAVINAVKAYKSGSNTFSSYVIHTIKNAYRETFRKYAKFDAELSLNAPIAPGDESAAEFIDYTCSQDNLEDTVLTSERISEVREVLSMLPEDEVELLNMLFYRNYSLPAYARKKGITQAEASRKKRTLLKKLSYFLYE